MLFRSCCRRDVCSITCCRREVPTRTCVGFLLTVRHHPQRSQASHWSKFSEVKILTQLVALSLTCSDVIASSGCCAFCVVLVLARPGPVRWFHLADDRAGIVQVQACERPGTYFHQFTEKCGVDSRRVRRIAPLVETGIYRPSLMSVGYTDNSFPIVNVSFTEVCCTKSISKQLTNVPTNIISSNNSG